MKNMILTSTGFETRNIMQSFINLLPRNIAEIKAIFVPTAAIDKDTIDLIPKCKNDLIRAGIKDDNIFVYNLDYYLDYEIMKEYDVIYFCGGSPEHLLNKIDDASFRENLIRFIIDGKIFIGVSAGSLIVTNNYFNGLKIVDITLGVHHNTGDKYFEYNIKDIHNRDIKINNQQAIYFNGEKINLIE